MTYRKFKADYLFDGFKMRRNDQVLICLPDGSIEDLVAETGAGEGLEEMRGMLSPGFVNCHCHLELSDMKGLIPEKQGLVNFVFSVVSHRNQPRENRLEAILQAETDMIKAGIVAVGDICNGGDTIPAKSKKKLAYYNFLELLGWQPEQAASRFEAAGQLAVLFREAGQDEISLSLSPHAPYSVSAGLWDMIMPGFPGKTITIHNQESAAENEFFLSGTGDLMRMYSLMKINSDDFKAPGITSLSSYLFRLKNAENILLVHNTYMEEADLLKARDFKDGLFFCFCPNANLYIENRLPDIPVFLKNNARMVLGTDSLAGNHQLNILEEMKTIKKTFPAIQTSELLVWATSNGAKALSFDKNLGDFSRGKKPGVVLIENLEGGEITGDSVSRRIF